jgi:hypothetical protein
MRLSQVEENGEFSLTDDLIGNSPPYAILSYTWGEDHQDVSFKDLSICPRRSIFGCKKLRFCAEQAARDGLRSFWVTLAAYHVFPPQHSCRRFWRFSAALIGGLYRVGFTNNSRVNTHTQIRASPKYGKPSQSPPSPIPLENSPASVGPDNNPPTVSTKLTIV